MTLIQPKDGTSKRIAANAKVRIDRGPVVVVSPVDFSFCELKSIAEVLDEDPRPSPEVFGVQSSSKGKNGKSSSKSIKFNNNKLPNVNGLNAFVETFLVDIHALCWLDLSFNNLKIIDTEILGFPNLKILNLHENKIVDISEVDKLRSLQNLKKLSLYGNPLASRGYRMMVLSKLKQLEEFDFSRITRAERMTSDTLHHFGQGSKPKTVRTEDDE